MRIYIIGNDGITLCSEPPAASRGVSMKSRQKNRGRLRPLRMGFARGFPISLIRRSRIDRACGCGACPQKSLG
jgi:hypothetical protein